MTNVIRHTKSYLKVAGWLIKIKTKCYKFERKENKHFIYNSFKTTTRYSQLIQSRHTDVVLRENQEGFKPQLLMLKGHSWWCSGAPKEYWDGTESVACEASTLPRCQGFGPDMLKTFEWFCPIMFGDQSSWPPWRGKWPLLPLWPDLVHFKPWNRIHTDKALIFTTLLVWKISPVNR